MKQFLPIAWWLSSTLFVALILISLGYRFSNAMLLGLLFLPGMLSARYFVPQLSFSNRKTDICNAIYLTLAILWIEYFALILGNYYIYSWSDISTMPGLLLNPFFLLSVLTAFVVPGMLLEKYLEARYPYTETVNFVSDRRKISLTVSEIVYIESNDSEVWIHTASGEAYRTKTRISQWESQLDRRFLRIHRSYIVNTLRIDQYHPAHVVIGGQTIEISRKYKEEVRQQLKGAEEQDRQEGV